MLSVDVFWGVGGICTGAVGGGMVVFRGGDVVVVVCVVEFNVGIGVVGSLSGVSKWNVRGVGYWTGECGVFGVSLWVGVFVWRFCVVSGKCGSSSLEIFFGISYGKVNERLFE